MAPEIRFLLDVLAAGPGEGPPKPAPEINWPLVLASIDHHRIAPLLTGQMLTGTLVPEAYVADLSSLRRRAGMRGLELGAELARLIVALDGAGIETLALKGPALSVQLHGNVGLRPARDLDLLVRPHAEAAAIEALVNLGYRPAPRPRWEADVTLERPGATIPVELHVRLAKTDALLPCAILRPFDTAVTVSVAGVPVRTLGLEAAVVHMAYHGAHHHWRRLFWLCDLAVAIRGGAVRWPEAADLARRVGVERHFTLALLLARDLLGVPVPAGVGPILPVVRAAAVALRPVVTAPMLARPEDVADALGRLGLLWWDLRLWTRPAARWALLVEHARPTVSDRAVVRLPRWLSGLYVLIRVGRVLLRAALGSLPTPIQGGPRHRKTGPTARPE